MTSSASVPPGLRLLAEEMWFVIPPPPGANRVVTDRYVSHVPKGPLVAFTGAGLLRFRADELDEVVAEVRERARAHGRDWVTWWVGPSASPPDLADRLRALGAVPLDDPSAEPRYTAMVLVSEPPVAPAIDARPVRDLVEFEQASEIWWEVSGEPDDVRARHRRSLAEHYERRHLTGESVTYLAWLGGLPIATAWLSVHALGAALNGAGTLPAYRGRGAYRALVHARWRDAIRQGSPGLAVMGGPMSEPILRRLGFVSLGTIDVLHDRFGAG